MVHTRLLATVLLATLWASPSIAATDQLPNTPIGEVFHEWFLLANHPERNAMRDFIKRYSWEMDLDQEMMVPQQDGYSIMSVEESRPDSLAVRIKAVDGTELIGKVDITKTTPVKVLFLGMYEISPGTTYAPFATTAKDNRAIASKVADAVRKTYFDRTAGDRIAKVVVDRSNEGAYDGYTAGELLEKAVNDDLHKASHDQHLNLAFYLIPPNKPSTLVPDPEQIRRGLAKHNCGFVRVEHLPPNIGYVKFDSFALPNECGETANAAMRFVADSDAVIFDLRDNGGGVPAMVSYLESYLFDKSTHLNDVYYRKDDETHQFWTLPFLSGKRIPNAPVFVLTSKNTFSAAEEFAYTLQALKRATIVGETTAGGAHPYDAVTIDDHFIIEVPFARSINPVTKSDWEGTGVVPDVKVAAGEALDRAVALAKESKAK